MAERTWLRLDGVSVRYDAKGDVFTFDPRPRVYFGLSFDEIQQMLAYRETCRADSLPPRSPERP